MSSNPNATTTPAELIAPRQRGNGAQAVPQPSSLRSTMAMFATGVTVLTAPGEHCHGMTANAFSSVSLEPPLVLCCVQHTARMHTSMTASGSFAVSVLSAEQEELARYFAHRGRPSGIAQFEPVDWAPGPHTGAPLLRGALAWLECELTNAYEGGDHSIFLGRVTSSWCIPEGNTLIFFNGGFRRMA